MCSVFRIMNRLRTTLVAGALFCQCDAMMLQLSQSDDSSDAGSRKAGSRRPAAKYMNSDDLTALGSEFEPSDWSNTRPHIILGIGFPQCGSHHFWEILAKHSDIIPGPAKEMMYFEWPADAEKNACHATTTAGLHSRLKNNLTDEAHFYAEACFGAAGKQAAGVPKKGENKRMLFEFSPGYTAFPPGLKQDTVLSRIAEVNSNATLRMIALVRDPIDRAASEVNLFRENGRLHGKASRVPHLPEWLKSLVEGKHQNGGINGSDEELSEELHKQMPDGYPVAAGMYGQRLGEWLERFGKDQILVVNTAALNNTETWVRIFRHVGLPSHSANWIRKAVDGASEEHAFKSESTSLHLTEHVREELASHYSADSARLWDLLNVRKPWW